MEKLIFACQWDRDRINSWSGTNNAIYQRLKQYFDLTDFDYGISSPYTFLVKCLNKAKIISRVKMMKRIKEHYSKVIDKSFDNSIPSFQFGEINSRTNRKTYCYQDLSILYVREMKESLHDIFEVSSFEELDSNVLDCWCQDQLEYYLNPNTTIFTMGHWLREWLIEKLNLPQERVIYCGGGIIWMNVKFTL